MRRLARFFVIAALVGAAGVGVSAAPAHAGELDGCYAIANFAHYFRMEGKHEIAYNLLNAYFDQGCPEFLPVQQ